MMFHRLIWMAGSLLMVCGTLAQAQSYPSKTIRIITGSVGGGSDFNARQIATGISAPLGQPVVVENRAGTLGSIDPVLKAAPDGYTLLVSGAALWIIPLLQKSAPWDTMRDFVPVVLIERSPFVMVAHQSMPVKSVRELIALAKARPGDLNYAAGNVGGTTHLAMELFKSLAGIKIVNVNFKGGAAGITALITGEVHVAISEPGVMAPHVKSGRVHVLAVTSASPSDLSPGVPTVAASGLPGYEWVGMTGVFAPARTPDAIVNRLNQEIVRLLGRPEVRERYIAAGTEVAPGTAKEFAATINADIARISKVIREANIKLD